MSNEILQRFILKYGKEIGIKKYRYSRSLDAYVLRYGALEGTEKYEKHKASIKLGLKSIPSEKKAEMSKKLSKALKGRKGNWHNTKEEFLKKYGDEEGLKRYNSFRLNLKNNSLRGDEISNKMKYINSKQYYLDKYGKDWNKKYKEWKKSQDHGSLSFFIKKYGEKDGTEKYISVCKSKFIRSYFSKISQCCFEEILSFIKDDELVMFGENELQLYYTKDGNKRRFCYDFCYGKKIIEFNGDRWHCNPKFFNENDLSIKKIKAKDIWDFDKIKSDFAKSKGYDVFTIWEDDWKNNKTETLKKALTFLGITNV